MYDEMNVYKIDILDKNIDDNKEIIKVKLISRYMDYIIDNDTKNIKKGINDHRVEKINYLTFERNINNSNNKMINKCSNCGANLDINYNGICEYCKQPIINNNDYILCKIE